MPYLMKAPSRCEYDNIAKNEGYTGFSNIKKASNIGKVPRGHALVIPLQMPTLDDAQAGATRSGINYA